MKQSSLKIRFIEYECLGFASLHWEKVWSAWQKNSRFFNTALNSCFSTSDSSKFTNNQNVPTFISLVLGSGNMISVEIWSSIQVLKGLLLSLVKKQYLNANTHKQNRGKLIQAHKSQKDKSKNTKWHFKHARPRFQRMLRPNGPGSWKTV